MSSCLFNVLKNRRLVEVKKSKKPILKKNLILNLYSLGTFFVLQIEMSKIKLTILLTFFCYIE